ncbi:MAG TPA: hypothetical protein VND01_00530 [Candidatus Acidoferrales bacterium]|nr:hypothetical protein [Candidatus Acidoferrales bacterium]
MGCRFGKHNYRYTQGVFRCKKCGHVTYKSHNRKKNKTTTILIPVIIVIAIAGYFVYQTYGTPQSIQNEVNNIISNTGNTIQQISSQSKQSISNLQTTVASSPNEDNRIPIAVYDNCQSTVRTDLKSVETFCYPSYKQFKFPIPAALEQGLQSGEALTLVKTTVYQYSTTDFKIGLYDQVGEKNYTVTLWQLPQ